jgi:hypothetical protein
MIGLPCECAVLGKLSNSTNVALIFNPADFVKMVFAQDLKMAARTQTMIFKRLYAATNIPQSITLHSIVPEKDAFNDALYASFGCRTGQNRL